MPERLVRHVAVGLLGVLVVVLSFVLAIRRRDARAARTRRSARRSAREAADQRALRAAAAIGLDASGAAPVRFRLCFPDRAAAERAATSAVVSPVMPRVIEVGPSPRGTTWLCLVTFDMTPTDSVVAESSARMVAIAGEHGGELDGWEVAIPW